MEHTLEPVEESPWADPIGPLYSQDTLHQSFGYTPEQIEEMVDQNRLVSIFTSDEPPVRLFPVDQFDDDGNVRPAATEIWQTLKTGSLGDYMRTSWLNKNHDAFERQRAWDLIIKSPQVLDPRIHEAARRMIARFAQ